MLVTDENGEVQEIINIADAGGDIERFEGILSPGFINCHCHLELSHMQGIVPQGEGMIEFLLTVMGNREASTEIIYEAIEKAEASMIDSGIVAVGDICNTNNTLLQKKERNIYYHNFIEATGFIEGTADARFNSVINIYNDFRSLGEASGYPNDYSFSDRGIGSLVDIQDNYSDFNSGSKTSIVPHAPYSVSANLFKLINNFEYGSLLTMHNQESQAENEFFIKGTGGFIKLYKALKIELNGFKPTGKTSLVSSIERITNDHPIILVHNVVTNEDDLQWLNGAGPNRQLYWCLCPNANLYINDRLPDVPLLRNYNCKIVVGTDSLASNYSLNILDELKTLQSNFPDIETAELLRWSTINGAEALGIENDYGSFDKGKMPGVVIIRNIEEGRLIDGSFSRRII